jgi:hypothetical protein
MKLLIFFGLLMMDDVHCASPVDTKLDRGHVRGSLGKGSGVLLPGMMASFLVKDAFGHIMEIVPSS